MGVDLLNQERGLSPGFRFRRAPALLRKDEQPRDDTDNDGQREEYFPENIG